MKSYQRQLPHLGDRTELQAVSAVDIPEHLPPGGLSIMQIYMIARHYWRQSAIIAAVMVVALAVFIKLLPRTYTATATLIVNTARENPLPDQYGGNDLPDYVATQAELITSPAVLMPVVDRLHLTDDPRWSDRLRTNNLALLRDVAERNLASSVNVEQGRGGQLLEISVSAADSVQATVIANTVADVYLQEDRARSNDPVNAQAQLSSQELAQLRSKVTDAQSKVTAFRDQHGLTSITGDADTEMQGLTDLQTRLLEVQNQRRALEAQQVGAVGSGDEALASTRVGALREQLATLQGHLAQLRPTLGPKHPEVLGLEAQIRATERSLRGALDNLSSNVTTQLMRMRELESELTHAVVAQRAKVLQLRQIQDQGSKLALELQSAQSVYKQALDGFDQVKFSAVQNFANVSLVSRASPPLRPSKPKKMHLLVLAVLASIGTGILLPFLYELWVDRRVRCRDDLERGLGVRVLAQLDPGPLLSEDPMNVETREELVEVDAEELREALVAYCRLSTEAEAQISEAMRATHMSFNDAAVHVGLVTETEAAEAYAWVRASTARRHSNIVETALRRQSAGRGVTLRHSTIGKPSNRLLPACDPSNPHSEQLRALRTELLLLNEARREASVTAVMSPCPHEGRSQLAAELAIAFSQLGRRTLLIDADLRRPAQHSLFGAEVQWGLAQSLAFGEPPHLVGVEGLPFLTVLPAGPRVVNPLELLSGGRLESLLRQWRHEQAFIVLDTPAVSQYADALTVAAIAGQVVLVTRAQATPYKELQGLLRRLGPTQARVLGAVVNAS